MPQIKSDQIHFDLDEENDVLEPRKPQLKKLNKDILEKIIDDEKLKQTLKDTQRPAKGKPMLVGNQGSKYVKINKDYALNISGCFDDLENIKDVKIALSKDENSIKVEYHTSVPDTGKKHVTFNIHVDI